MAIGADLNPGRVSGLTERERVRLAGILARLASPYEGERAAAGLLASRVLTDHGLQWSDLMVGPAPAAEGCQLIGRERRRPNRNWRGYCRRQSQPSGRVLSRIA